MAKDNGTSYQHGEGFPHAGGQAGQDVTVILLVDSSAHNIGLYLSSQQKLHGNQIFNSLPCYTWKSCRSAGRAAWVWRSWQYLSLTLARRCRKRGSPRCPPPNLYIAKDSAKMELFFSEVHLDDQITQTPHRSTPYPSPMSIWRHIGGHMHLLQNFAPPASSLPGWHPPPNYPAWLWGKQLVAGIGQAPHSSTHLWLWLAFHFLWRGIAPWTPPGWTAPSMQAASCNADLQISKEILRNQCEKVTQQTWPDWRGRWRNWRVGVRGPQWPCEIFQIVSKWQNLKLIHDWIQFNWAF